MDDLILRGKRIQLHIIDSAGHGMSDEQEQDSDGSGVLYDELSLDERTLVSRYRELDNVERLAIRCFFNTGDLRLVRAIYDRVFLGLRRR